MKINKMSKILVIGDIMLDKYSYGDVKRLNPEGPNSLINITKEEYRLGGASNVAANIASLNGTCDLIGLVGDDENKNIFKKISKYNNINFKEIVLKEYKTIVKQRFIEKTYNQQLLRVDYEEKLDSSNNKLILSEILKIIYNNKYEIIVISDYAKGIIFKELIEAIKLNSKNKGIKLICDIKPININYFSDVFLIKPNFKEFCEIIGKNIENIDSEIEKYGKEYVKKMNINLIVTRGDKGASLITQNGDYFHIKIEAQKIFDVTGAGDTFISAITYALINNLSLKKAIKIGNKASGIVIGKVGTAIIQKEELF